MTEKLPDLILTISIDRPTTENPDGYICLQAHTAKSGEDVAPKFEDGADGPHNDQTVANIIADFKSYVRTGHKETWANRVKKPGQNGHHGREK